MNSSEPTPGSVVSQAAKTSAKISRYAQGALLLFAIANIIAGWSGNKLAIIILTAVVVLGFMIALLGFERLARAKAGYYAKLALVLTTIVLVSAVTLFVTVLVYLGTGHPVWLDRFFGHEMAPAPSASIDHRAVSSGQIALDLKPYLNPEAEIEVSLYESGGDRPVREPKRVSAQQEQLVLDGLQPATRYRIRLIAIARSRESLPLDLTQATNAERMAFNIPDHPEAIAHYSGPLTDELVPDAESGSVAFEDVGGSWMYDGPVRKGLLDGEGRMSLIASPEAPACDDAALGLLRRCTSSCDGVVFKHGHFQRATCGLVLSNAIWREKGDQFGIDARGAYVGGIAPAESGSQIRLGPYAITFDGDGILMSGKTTVNGTWRDGALQGAGHMVMDTGEIRIGDFEDGLLKKGQVFGQPFPFPADANFRASETISYDVVQFGPNGNAVRLGRDGFAFGTIRNSDPRGPFFPGFEGKFTDRGFILKRYDEAHRTGEESRPSTEPKNTDCHHRETFGLDVNTTDWFLNKGWKLHTINHLADSTDAPGERPSIEITLEIAPADIHVRSFRTRGEPADIRFWVGNNFATTQAVEIDGLAVSTNTINAARQLQSALTLSRLCSAQNIKNLTNGISADVSGFCPVVAIVLARTYFCDPSPDWSLASDWRPEEKIGNWLVTQQKSGGDRNHLTVTSADAELRTTTAQYEYNIRYACSLDGTHLFGLGLWGTNLTGDKPGATRDFKFSANGIDSTYTLTMPQYEGAYHISEADRKPIADLLRSSQNVTVSFTSWLGETVAFEFSPEGAEEALGAVLPSCPS